MDCLSSITNNLNSPAPEECSMAVHAAPAGAGARRGVAVPRPVRRRAVLFVGQTSVIPLRFAAEGLTILAA